LFEFEESASDNPTFYADTADPQSLNKYVYTFNNPLRFVDSDGHQGGELIKTLVRCAINTQIGVDKAGLNLLIGVHNLGAGAIGAKPIAPLEPNGGCQQVAQHATDVAAVVVPLAGGAGPVTIMTADVEETTVVSSELANPEPQQLRPVL